MKLFIITEGNRKAGFGHITRCSALASGFEDRGVAPEFIVNGDESVRQLLKGRRHTVFNWLAEKERLFDAVENSDAAIVDSYMADYAFCAELSNAVKLPVYLDDVRRIDFPKGMVVNGAISAENINYTKNDDTVYLLGVRYFPLRREFAGEAAKRIKPDIESVMVSFGGGDIRNMTPVILKFLKAEYPHLAKNVIIGGGFCNLSEIEKLKERNIDFIYNPDAGQLKMAMQKSDLAISACGQTLYELARLGVPTVGISVVGNQETNVRGWREAGFLEFAGQHDEPNLPVRLRRAVSKLLPEEERKKRSKIATGLIDGQGVARIVERIWKKAGAS
jgi:spore coat polysaccharide biosynthesis predicted glycosyltransferase SpsG